MFLVPHWKMVVCVCLYINLLLSLLMQEVTEVIFPAESIHNREEI